MSEGGVELATGYVSLVISGQEVAPGVKKALGAAAPEADRAGRKAGKSYAGGFGRSMKSGAALLGIGALGAAAASFIKGSVNLEASFSKTMAQVAAATDAPASSLEKMSGLAKKLGKDTAFSANEASGAMLELAKAGISTSDIMGGALQGTLLLATAGSTDLGTAATIASNAMNTFGLKGKDMSKIAAALAGGANASSASVESLGQALAQVGPGATNAGLSLQETIGTLSAFDAAGVKGSDAGTSLKTMLANLVPQTDKARAAMAKYNLEFVNADGSFKDITNIAGQLRRELGGLDEAQRSAALTTLFGSDASRAATVLMKQGEKGLRKYIRATKDQNAAEKLAKANMSGTAGAMERLSGSIETAQLALGEALAPTIVEVADFLADKAAPAVADFFDGMREGKGVGGDVAEVLGDVVAVGKGIVDLFDSLPGPVKEFGVKTALALLAVNKLSGLTGGGGLGMAMTRAKQFGAELSYTGTRMAAVSRASNAFGGQLRNVAGVGGMIAFQQGLSETNTALSVTETTLGGFAAGFMLGGPIGGGIGAGIGAFLSLKNAISGTNDVRMPTTKALGIDDIVAGLDKANAAVTQFSKDTLFDFISGKTKGNGPPGLQAGGGIRATAQMYGIPDRQLIKAMSGDVKAFEAIKRRFATAMKSKDPTTATLAMTDRDTVVGAIQVTTKEFRRQRQQMLENIAANKDYGDSLNALPAAKQTKVEATGIVPTLAGVAKVAAAINATPEEVATLIKAAGVPFTVKQIQAVINKTREADRQRANPKISADTSAFYAALAGMRRAAAGLGFLFDAGGADGNPLTPGREHGGPVMKGQPYIVGERRPELFIPNESGRIVPRVPSSSVASGPVSLAGQRVTLSLFGRQIEGVFEEVADARIDGARGYDGMTERAFT